MSRRSVVFIAVLSLVASLAVVAPASAEETVEQVTVTSLAEDQTTIAITVFKPAAADAANQAPVIFDSHGWGGARRQTVDGTVRALLDAGFGVVSIDQRGHGESGGLRNVQDPALEGQDIKAVIDYTATALPWVLHNTDAEGNPIADNPVLGAIGGSYGGGYQTMTALTEISETGSTRFDALAPEITWYDLPTALAPQGVARTSWITALYATAKAPENTVPEFIDQSFAWGAATGQWPGREVPFGAAEEAAGIPNMTEIFRSHSPRGFADQGIKLNIPVLQRQGITDNLFNLNEGLHIFEDALTAEARAKSVFTGYNGGHVLPAVGSTLPLGSAPSGDPCNDEYTGGWNQMRIDFFTAAFNGGDPTAVAPNKYNFATDDGGCIRVDSLPAADNNYEVDPAGLGGWGTPVGVFAPQNQLLATGPLQIAGIPKLTGEIYNGGADTRAFFALAVGTSEADATVIQNNMMPLRQLLPVSSPDPVPFSIELPGIAVELAAGENLYLTISPISDTSFGHGSRTPGLMVITDLTARIPVI
jgi:pimeloyl-ACP methyl ester carboxylesterase